LFMVRTGGFVAGYVVPVAGNLAVRMAHSSAAVSRISEFTWATIVSNVQALFRAPRSPPSLSWSSGEWRASSGLDRRPDGRPHGSWGSGTHGPSVSSASRAIRACRDGCGCLA
jgi:hypothetical protein